MDKEIEDELEQPSHGRPVAPPRIRELVEYGASIDEEKDALLSNACAYVPISEDAFEVIAYLLKIGANPNLAASEDKLLPLDFVEHFCSCYEKWCSEGRTGYSKALEGVSLISVLLREAGAKRASEL